MNNDFIAKISRKGYDVGTCSDRELLMCSEWPGIKIWATGTFTNVASFSANFTALTQNSPQFGIIQVYPMFLVYIQDASGSHIARTTEMTITCSTTTISGSVVSPLTQASGRYYIFALPILDDYISVPVGAVAKTYVSYPTLSKTDSTKMSKEDDFVFAISKSGKDVSSTDMRDFSIHSSCRNLMVSSVTAFWHEEYKGFVGTVTHNLGYKPIYFVYTRELIEHVNPDLTVTFYPESVFRPATGIDVYMSPTSNDSITIYGISGPREYSIVILKDNIQLQ